MITKHIIELVNLALKDYELTDKERKVIVDEALKKGASWQEINSYIDLRLKENKEKMPKELLKSCPVCGGQIPLISNVCKYCNSDLNADNQSSREQIINYGTRIENIIESENQRIEKERYNLDKCPDCGANFPLIGRICGYCGYIFQDLKKNNENILTLTQNMLSEINNIKNIRISIKEMIKYRHPILVALMAIPLFVHGGVKDNGFYIALCTYALLYAIIMGIINRRKESPTKIASEQLWSSYYNYKSFEREVQTLYGNDKEAKDLLNNLKITMKKKQKENKIKNCFVIVCFMILFILATSWLFSFGTKIQSKTYFSNKKDYKELYNLIDKEAVLTNLESKSKELKGIVASKRAIFKVEFDNKKVEPEMVDRKTDLRFYLYDVRIINYNAINKDSICLVAHIYNKDKIEIAPDGKYDVVIQCIDSTNLLGDKYYTFKSVGNYIQKLDKEISQMLDSAKYFSIEIPKNQEKNGK